MAPALILPMFLVRYSARPHLHPAQPETRFPRGHRHLRATSRHHSGQAATVDDVGAVSESVPAVRSPSVYAISRRSLAPNQARSLGHRRGQHHAGVAPRDAERHVVEEALLRLDRLEARAPLGDLACTRLS